MDSFYIFALGFAVGCVFAYLLFCLKIAHMKKDPEEFIDDISRYLDGEISLDELIKRYGVNEN